MDENNEKAKALHSSNTSLKKNVIGFAWVIVLFIVLAFALSQTRMAGVSGKNNVLTTQQEAVKKRFQGKNEPAAKNAIWVSKSIFKLSVTDDGTSRDGYAAHVCEVLYDYGFRGQKKLVQVVNVDEPSNHKDAVKLGESQCE